MASLIKYTALNPVVTGAALYALTRAPAEIKEKAVAALAALPGSVDITVAVRVLKVLFTLGGLRLLNRLLNRWAHNHYAFSTGAVPWVWDKELCVVTGGSGGLGQIVTRHLIKKGVRVAIFDIAPPPQELLNCEYTKSIGDQANTLQPAKCSSSRWTSQIQKVSKKQPMQSRRSMDLCQFS